MPAQPYRYTYKQGPYNVPMGQSYDFWKANPWQNMFKDQTKRYGQLGNQFLGQYAGMSPDQMRMRFGYRGGVGPNDPSLGQWTNQMSGNVGNALRQGANRMAGAGVASSRGGMALPGSDLRSVLGQQANEQVAGMASQNFQNAVQYENERRRMDNLVASALSNLAGQQMQTGLGLMGLELGGTQSADASLARWLQGASQAFSKDTDLYNQMVGSEGQRRFQDQQMQHAMQQMERDNQRQDLISRLLGHAYTTEFPWEDYGQIAQSKLQHLKGLGLLGG